MNELIESNPQLMEILGAESLSVQTFEHIITDDSLTFPLADMFSLGSVFSSLFSAMKGSEKLYKAVIPAGKVLAEAKDGSGSLGTLLDSGGIAGQARFHEVDNVAQKASAAGQMFMALAIMAINKSLEEVANNQKKIIAFLETDKQTQLEGDLVVLSEIIGEYQHNWKNPQFLTNRENQVLDIKRAAEHNIMFYREMAENEINKKAFVRLDTQRDLNSVQNKFRYYRLALYLYSFSSFLDVMLLGNYDAAYLTSITDRIRKYSEEYEDFHEKSIKGVGEIAESSVESRVLQGLSFAGGFLGKQIAKIPEKKLRFSVDEFLIGQSEKMGQKQKAAVDKTVEAFSNSGKNEAMLFVDKIDLVNKLYNEPITLCFDKENIYLQVQTEET
ncbi:MAG: hypothetical protein IKG97_05590 [Lachnospiraceae bacterium]|nr:hypothetical protein [Lachnospiraceae bacterium]